MAQMSMDDFEKIMDEYIEKNDVKMLIEIPAGTMEPQVKDSIGAGGVMQLFILLTAIRPIYRNIYEMLDKKKEEEFVDGILELVKADMMDVWKE